MDPRKSMKQYPRQDQIYKTKQSLNFDAFRSKIYEDREGKDYTEAARWIAHGIAGIIIGAVAFFISYIEDGIIEWRAEYTQELLLKNEETSKSNTFIAYLFYAGISCTLVLVATLLTVYVGPGAYGSGVAEIMGHLNGVNYPNVLGFKTLFTKIWGTVFAVTGGLCIGKEGPLAHIGANIAIMTAYMPFEGFRTLQNDVHKRQLMAAGVSAGVSAAFGAPIGGALFSYEISKPNTFWTFSMLWRIFFCSSVSTFTLSVFTSLWSDAPFTFGDQATLKFGKLQDSENSFLDIPAAIVIGCVCGLLGALFISVNSRLGMYRKKYIKEPWQKITESLLFALLTATAFFCAALTMQHDCQPSTIAGSYQFKCSEGNYNPLASLIFNTEGGTIRQIMNIPIEMQNNEGSLANHEVVIFFVVWYIFTITTYGVWVPAGLFLPGILIGSCVGLAYLNVTVNLFDLNIEKIGGQSYIIIGASAMLSAYCRLTYSLAVIMLETTQSINLFLPVICTLFFSFGVARCFNRSLYERALRAKQMPVLRNHVPKVNRKIRAVEIMESRTVFVESVPTVERLAQVLQTTHSAFPVLNMAGNIVGMIPKNFLIILLENHRWYKPDDKGNKEFKPRDESVTKMFRTSEYRRGKTNYEKDKVDFEDLDDQDHQLRRELFDKPNLAVQQLSNVYLQRSNTKSDSYSAVDLSNSNRDELTASSGVEDDISPQQRMDIMIKEYTNDQDYEILPECQEPLEWWYFNTDLWSSDRTYSEVKEICIAHQTNRIDLRPYLIETPYIVQTTDKLPKILDLFRHMHLRHLPVVSPADGSLRGIITRQDIFAYMSL